MTTETFLILFSFIIGLIGVIPYITLILKRVIYPHPFSWFVWSLSGFVVFLAQKCERGGIGSYITLLSSLQCLFIAFLAFRSVRWGTVTKSDWYTLGYCVFATLLWPFTKTPLYSVILITLIDLVAFYPSFRKGYFFPFEDMPLTFLIAAVKFAPSLFLFEEINFTNSLFPLIVIFEEVSMVIMLVIRRWQLKRTSKDPEIQKRSLLI